MTDGKQEPDTLKAERDFLAAVLDRVGSLVVVLDREGRIVHFNRACEETTGYSFEEVKGKYFWDLFLVAEELDAVKGVFQQLRAGHFPNRYENYWLKKDGTRRLIAWSNDALVNAEGAVEYLISNGIDITERRQAEAALRESEEALRKSEKLYRTLIQNFPNSCVLLFDSNLRYTIADGQGLAAVGLSKEGIEGKTLWEVFSPEMCETLEPLYRSVLAGTATTSEIPYRDRIGYVQALPVRNEQGEIFAGMVVVQDITERKQAEEAQIQLIASLRESEQRFRCLIDQARDGIIAIDSNGWFVEVNQRACQDLGYTYAEMLTLGVWDLDPIWFQKKFIELFAQQAAEDTDDTVEAIIRRKDGSTFPVEIRLGLLEWNQQQYMLALVRDITKRKRVERVQTRLIEFLQKSDERFRQMSENIRDVFWMRQVNPPKQLYVSPAYQEIWSRSCNSLYQQPQSFFDALHSEDKERVQTAIAQQMQGISTDMEYRIIRPDGSVRWIHDRAFPIRNRLGELYRITGIAEDITERKRVEEALAKANEELGIKVEAKTIELSTAIARLQQEIVRRKKMEFALRESEERFRSLVANIPGAIYRFDCDSDWTVEFISDAIAEISGYPAADFIENRFRTLKSIIHPEDRQKVEWIVRHALVFQRPYMLEYRIIRADGMIRWVSDKGQAKYGKNREILWIDGAIFDVTVRQQVEHEQRQSAERLRLVVQNMPVMLDAYDEQGNLIVWNRECERVTGYNATEMVGNPNALNLLYPDPAYREQVMTKRQKIENNFRNWEIEITCKDGTVKTIAWSNISKQFPIPGWAGWGIGVDISDRKCAEAALRISEQRQAFLLRSVPVVLYTSSASGAFAMTWMSENVEGITGFLSNQFVTDPSLWGARLHPQDRETVYKELHNLFDGEGYQAIEYRWQCADSSYRWFLDRGVLIRDEEGKPKEIIGSWLDITQRKQAEEEIRKALDKEKELNELKSRFITMASHEFRTPLSTILSSADLLEYYVQESFSQKQLEHIRRIQTACLNMEQLLNDVLVIGKAEAGKAEFNPSPLDLEQFCRHLVEELQLSAGNQHVITFELGTVTVRGHRSSAIAYPTPVDSKHITPFLPCLDEKLLRHILNNLLSNAIKYSPKRGNIYFKLFYKESCAIFEVADEGIGIPPEDQEHLFEPFHRGKNVGTISGTGLGLAIVKRSVDLHRGQISLQSEIGVGTTFTVMLPLYSSCSHETLVYSG